MSNLDKIEEKLIALQKRLDTPDDIEDYNLITIELDELLRMCSDLLDTPQNSNNRNSIIEMLVELTKAKNYLEIARDAIHEEHNGKAN